MSRSLFPVALGAVLATGALLVVVALSSTEATSPAAQADALAAELRCPDCQGLSVADSPTESAREIRRQIDEMLAAGASPDEVRAHFVARYGEWILLAPSAPLAWLVPFATVLAGIVGLAMWRVRRGSAAPHGEPSLTDPERQRLRDEAEALDG